GTRTGVDKTSATGTGLKWKDVDSNKDGKIDARDTARAVPDFTRPLASFGAVLQGRSYSVDVTAGVASGPGVYTLALTGLKPALASYVSRENRTGNGPVLHLVVAAPARRRDAGTVSWTRPASSATGRRTRPAPDGVVSIVRAHRRRAAGTTCSISPERSATGLPAWRAPAAVAATVRARRCRVAATAS